MHEMPPQVWHNSRRQTESARSGPRIGTVQSVSPPARTVWTGSRVSLRQQRGIPNTRIHIAGTAEPSCMKCHRRCGIIAAGRLSLHAAARALARCRASARQRGTVWTGSRVSLRQQRGISEGEKKGNQKIPGTARTARPGAGTGGSGTLCSVHGGGRSALLRPSGVGSGICDPIHLLKTVPMWNCPDHQDALCRNSSGESINHKAACALCYPQGVFSTSPGKEGGILWKEI